MLAYRFLNQSCETFWTASWRPQNSWKRLFQQPCRKNGRALSDKSFEPLRYKPQRSWQQKHLVVNLPSIRGWWWAGRVQIINEIIIHSKYFPVSDWLEPHAQFTITRCCSPNLESIFAILNQWRQEWSVSRIIESLTAADYWTVDQEKLGTRLCYIWWAEKLRT